MKRYILITFLFFSVSFQGFSQRKLEKAKKSLNEDNSSSFEAKSKTGYSSSTDYYYSDNLILNILAPFFVYTTYGFLVEFPFEVKGRMHQAKISQYPYKEFYYGNFIYTDSTNYSVYRVDISNQLLLESKNLYANNLGVNFRFLKRLDFEVDYLQLFEKLKEKTDSFSLFSAMINYHRIRTQRLDLWFGLGAMYVANNVKKAGFAYAIGTEWFIKKPISVLFSYKATSINSKGVNKTKILLKYYLKNYHLSSGYEHFKLGVSNINAFSIGFGASF